MTQFKTKVIEPVERMGVICKRLAQDGKTIRFVPTMGSLHDGHGSLIRRAVEDPYDDDDDGAEDDHDDNNKHGSATVGRQPTTKSTTTTGCRSNCQRSISHNDNGGDVHVHGYDDDDGDSHERPPRSHVVIVSIFVNPKQFNNRDDFINYPNTLEADLEMCSRLKVDYVFVPKCEDIYSDPVDSTCIIGAPGNLANDLEGRSRPGHFEGMLTIVCKLFNIIRPDRAYFGEKDYQQLILVKKMVKSLNMQVRICQIETTRDPMDQLPLSSRNVRLSPKQRHKARVMYDILINTKDALENKCKLSTTTLSQVQRVPSGCPCDLELTILASLLATQCLIHDMSDANETSDVLKLDYLQLRCSEDFSTIAYNNNMGLYDCSEGCLRKLSNRSNHVLKTRLLTSVIVGDVRLLDNIEVELNKSITT